MLCIVNSRGHARDLYESIRDQDGAAHLTTLMCPAHRRAVLADLRQRLPNRQPVRLVATSLIEAGVDIDFPEVWRASAGLDSIHQAAGRYNREGLLAQGGRVVVFEPARAKPPLALKLFWQATRSILPHHADLMSLDAILDYFRELYWQKGEDALDALDIHGQRGVMATLNARARTQAFPFRTLAQAFRLIEDRMETVIVPWDEQAGTLLRDLAAMERPGTRQLRGLQNYGVGIPRAARDLWLARGVLSPVHPALGTGLLAFADLVHYRHDTGLDLAAIDQRAAEANIL